MGARRVCLGAATAIGTAVAPLLVSLASTPAGAFAHPPTAAVAAGSDAADFGSGVGGPLGEVYGNPRGPAAAVSWARNQVGGAARWPELCLNFTAQAYGWAYSGTHYAIDHYLQMPASLKHPGDRNPPRGALLFWDTGQRAGHVALGLGNGMIATNDINVRGGISVVSAEAIEGTWGARYLGWTAPYFPDGVYLDEPAPAPALVVKPKPKSEPKTETGTPRFNPGW